MNLFTFSLVIFLFSLAGISLESSPEPGQIELELPRPDFSLIIAMDIKPIEEIKANKKIIQESSSGFSPKKRGYRSFCLDTPKKKLLGVSATLEQVKKRKLFEDEKLSDLPCRIVNADESEYESSVWAYVDPAAPESSAAIDCGATEWVEIIEELVQDINFSNQETFIASTIWVINQKIDKIKKMLIFQKGDELVCRHFATLALPIFAKLLLLPEIPFKGTVHQISADIFKSDWSRADDGHVWNFLSLSESGTKSHWLVDVFQRRLINLSESPFLKRLYEKKVTRKGDIITSNLTKKSHFYDYARLTKEKFGLSSRNNIEKKPQAKKLAVTKVLARSAVPKARSIIVSEDSN